MVGVSSVRHLFGLGIVFFFCGKGREIVFLPRVDPEMLMSALCLCGVGCRWKVGKEVGVVV